MTDFADTNKQSGVQNSVANTFAGRFGFLLIATFTASMLLSALLLFFVQPMFSKMALPYLGGASGVWNTAMVFFQTMLLFGYLYAHLLSKYFSLIWQVVIHTAVILVSMVFLPIAIPENIIVPQTGAPMFWLIGLFTIALGAPFFALSANAPLLQKWFSYTSHGSADDPYFLYAASNLGSLLSLLSYPILVEPFFRVSTQSLTWAYGFSALLFCITACGFLARRYQKRDADTVSDESMSADSKSISWEMRILWTGCAIIPSGLMLGVTSHITANIASAPFLWVLPLALYLLTFIFAFSPKPFISSSFLKMSFPFIAIALIILVKASAVPETLSLCFHLLGFFAITQMCHNRLAENRPKAEFLTEFYFFMSLGGVLGGASIALAAPVIFNDSHEYTLMIIAAALLLPGQLSGERNFKREIFTVAALLLAIALLTTSAYSWAPSLRQTILPVIGVVLIAPVILLKNFSFSLPVILTGAWFIMSGYLNYANHIILQERSFFGVLKVAQKQDGDNSVNTFIHGNTIHNFQLNVGKEKPYPLAYYAPEGSFGQAIDAVRADKGNLSVAAIGLGAGALACHVQDGEDWRFYEIDPLVVSMARNPEYFTFIQECAPNVPIEVGDARLTLEKLEKNSQDLVIVDAFSSDSIPAHLVTKDALELYTSLLKEDGFVFFHTSNRSLDVTSVTINIAKSVGMSSRVVRFVPNDTMKHHKFIKSSSGVMIGDEASLERIFKGNAGWKVEEANSRVGTWTDDFSHIVGAMIASKFPDRQ